MLKLIFIIITTTTTIVIMTRHLSQLAVLLLAFLHCCFSHQSQQDLPDLGGTGLSDDALLAFIKGALSAKLEEERQQVGENRIRKCCVTNAFFLC